MVVRELLTLLASYGACFALRQEKVYLGLREDLLNCPFCLGFHTGWASYLLSTRLDGQGMFGYAADMILFAFASAAFCQCCEALLDRLER